MKIVQVAPNHQVLPPPRDGGTERIVYEITEALVKRGHDVILYAPKGSTSSARVIPYPFNSRDDRKIAAYVLKTMPRGFHLIHDHTFSSAIGLRRLKIPTVCTIHLARRNRVQHPVFVSRAARRKWGNGVGTVIYNGLKAEEYQFAQEKDDYLLFLGRVIADKGILEAIEVAERTDNRLVIAGPMHDKLLFKRKIEPRLKNNPKLQYVGPVGGQQRQDLLKRARCLLFPTRWQEPFGLVMIEAMVCGTPVLGLANGAVPEVLAGFPHFICDSVKEMVAKVKDLPEKPDSAKLRAYVTNQFTVERMIDRYVNLYQKVIRQSRESRVLKNATVKKGVRR
jgi:glycosyltransferase involved in cell wall biosynthesis